MSKGVLNQRRFSNRLLINISAYVSLSSVNLAKLGFLGKTLEVNHYYFY